MNKPKTIGIDARFFGEAGPGRYTKAIIEHLEQADKTNRYLVFLRDKGMRLYQPKNPNFIKVSADYPWYSWSEQTLFFLKVLFSRLDLLYVPHFNIPVLYPKKIVTAIPDIIMHSYSTAKGTTLPGPYFAFKKLVYRLVVLWAVIRSKTVIVPSKDVLADFRKLFPFVPVTKYKVVYEGVDPDYLDKSLPPANVAAKLNVKTPFLLYVGSMYEHKNIPNLLKAFGILKSKLGFKGNLVLVGKNDKFSRGIRVVADQMGVGECVIMPGLASFVTDKEVVALRVLASGYVFPSLKEGFSLTPMEAQAVGLPCAISRIPCHEEIYENSVLYFDPLNPEDIASKVNILLNDHPVRDELISKGLNLYKKFSWFSAAQETLEVFDKALGGKK